jgi:exopolysaccharide biosynthesis protein
LAGYTTFQKSDVAVVNVQMTGLNIALTKAPPKPVAVTKPKVTTPAPTTSSSSASTTYTSYSRQSVKASAGTYTVDIMKLDLGSGHIRVITDTAADGDCTNNCPTRSLASYASRNGAFAGINGTYFCPADYSSCAGQTGSFWWKFYNSRLGKMINATNGKGAMEPFFIFDSMGRASYLSHWNDYSSYNFTAGISSSPGLISGGVSVLNTSTLDTKQRTVKSNRGAIALKGQMLYAVIAKGATVPDLTSVLLALGVDYGLNIDGGGSSAMLYKGAYKVGPGRSLPNAVLFVEN